MSKMNGADALVRMLQLNGVKHIFGLCGDTSLPFYDALARLDHGIDHILTRDERSAAYMADAYARVTGKPGVCEGPERRRRHVPAAGDRRGQRVLHPGSRHHLGRLRGLARQVSPDGTRPAGALRAADQVEHDVDRADQVPGAVRSAFRAMTTGRPGAAHICLPYDLQKHEIDPADVWAQPGHDRFPAMRSRPHPADVEQAAEKLVAAKCPVIICGGGVVLAGACAALEALALMLNAPVCTTVSGKGTLADSHPLSVGVVGTNGGVLATREVVMQADLVLFVGARAGSTTTEHWKYPARDVPIVHIDVDAMTIGTNYRTDVALVGDAMLALADLNEAVRARLKNRPAGAADGRAIAGKARARKLADFAALAASTDLPIKPERVVDSLNRHLPAGAIVVADPGTPCPDFSAYFDVPQAGRHFITNRAHGALGFAMSAGVGAQFGRPDAMVVVSWATAASTSPAGSSRRSCAAPCRSRWWCSPTPSMAGSRPARRPATGSATSRWTSIARTTRAWPRPSG